jgi:tetratricopeptide (TPR) repeat protein
MQHRTAQFGLALAVGALTAAGQQPGALTTRDMSVVRLGTAQELKAPVSVPRGYAVVIGVSKYKNVPSDRALPFAEKDAENIYSALISKEGGQIEFQNVKKLLGPQATLANIREALETWLPANAKPTDRVVVYFVGHGLVDEKGAAYLAPYDVDPSKVGTTGYSMAKLGEVLSNQVKSGWKMLLVDACHSGQLSVQSTAAKVNEGLRGLPQGFLTLTSSRASENSYEDPRLAGGNGVFSYYLARGWLGESDVDPADGKVTADELVTYVKREVRAHVKSQGGQQTPLEFGDFPDNLILGFNPTRRGALVTRVETAVTGSAVIEANLDNVEVSIDDQRRGIAAPNMPLRVPGLSAGIHTVKGARTGYEPVTLEINVAPGSTQTVSLRLLYQVVPKAAAKALYDEGESIWRRTTSASAKDLAKSEDLLARALKEDPKYGAAALTLCRVQQAERKTGEALKSCKKAAELQSADAETRTMLGVLLMESGDFQAAARELQAATTQDPKNSFAHSSLAEALFLADRPMEAEGAAERALALNPSSGQAYLLRGEARRVQQRFSESVADYQHSLSVQDFNSGALRTAAFYAIGMGMRKNRSGNQGLYRSQAASAYFGLCAADIGLEDYRAAVGNCKKVLSIEKDDADAYLLLAEAHAGLFSENNRRAHLMDAKQSVEAVLRINPSHTAAPGLKEKLKEINELMASVR